MSDRSQLPHQIFPMQTNCSPPRFHHWKDKKCQHLAFWCNSDAHLVKEQFQSMIHSPFIKDYRRFKNKFLFKASIDFISRKFSCKPPFIDQNLDETLYDFSFIFNNVTFLSKWKAVSNLSTYHLLMNFSFSEKNHKNLIEEKNIKHRKIVFCLDFLLINF